MSHFTVTYHGEELALLPQSPRLTRWSPQPEGSLCFKHSTVSWGDLMTDLQARAAGVFTTCLWKHLQAKGRTTILLFLYVRPGSKSFLGVSQSVAFRRQKGRDPETVPSLFPKFQLQKAQREQD